MLIYVCLSLSLYIYIYICITVCVNIHVIASLRLSGSYLDPQGKGAALPSINTGKARGCGPWLSKGPIDIVYVAKEIYRYECRCRYVDM